MAISLVIGADKGIGRAVMEQLAARGDRVYAACLGEPVFDAENVIVLPRVDVTSDAAVRDMVRSLKADRPRLDFVFHIAGVLGLDALGSLDYEDMRRQFEINAIGPLRTIEAIRPFVGSGSRIGIVTSRVGSLADNQSGGMYAYRASKCAANMVGLNLHHDLKSEGITVLLLHPGMVATDLTKDLPGDLDFIKPAEAASGLIRNMDELTPENSGRFRHANGDYLPW